MDQPLSLHDALYNSYAQDPNALNQNGFNYDKDLSNDNEQVYYNPKQNKLLYTITGSHNLNDVGTDAYLAVGKIKDTSRYKNAEIKLEKAKAKYQPSHTTISGHSLGGSIASKLSGDRIITYNKGSTIGEKIIGNEDSYRTHGDVVSILNNKNTTTIHDKNKYYIPQLPTFRSITKNAYDKHLLKNIKHENIFI